ncbi:MAG: hypothetical protein Q8K63_02285 [Acidimicrobiales bacterium]|nr:hypothetical protein [Acidimicrobiales bacterium]
MTDRVLVVGPDASTYLQGQLSQDVAGLAVGGQAWSFVLAPNGHIDAFVQVTRLIDEEFALDVEAGFGEQLHARLTRFLLRTKADVTLHAGGGEPFAPDERTRIERGIPSMAADLDERAVPAETGWVADSVSFTKGCYTGQELVARMDSRVAEPPRRLVRLRGAGLVAGARLSVDGADVGSVTSAARDVGLGYVKRGTVLQGEARAGDAVIEIVGPVGA